MACPLGGPGRAYIRRRLIEPGTGPLSRVTSAGRLDRARSGALYKETACPPPRSNSSHNSVIFARGQALLNLTNVERDPSSSFLIILFAGARLCDRPRRLAGARGARGARAVQHGTGRRSPSRGDA